MSAPGRPRLRLVEGGAPDDPVTRMRRFEAAHPGTVIQPPSVAGRWRAALPPGTPPGEGSATVGAADLRGLMDRLEELCPPGGA